MVDGCGARGVVCVSVGAYGAAESAGAEGAVVGAGAVVTKDVESYAIVAGNPARKIADRVKSLHYDLDYKPLLV